MVTFTIPTFLKPPKFQVIPFMINRSASGYLIAYPSKEVRSGRVDMRWYSWVGSNHRPPVPQTDYLSSHTISLDFKSLDS